MIAGFASSNQAGLATFSIRRNPVRVPVNSARMNTLLTSFKTVRGLDSGPLCRYIQPYIALVHEHGYRPDAIRHHICLIGNFNQWLARTGRGLRDLNEATISAFLAEHFGQRTKQGGERLALLRMLCILRQARATPQAKAVQLTSAQVLVAQYREYLTKERGCSESTMEHYSRHIERFLARRFGEGSVRFEQIRGQDVIALVRREAGRHGRGYILQVVTGLRSFLRFLRYRGDLRAGEVVMLQLEDIDWNNGQLTIRSNKGGRLGTLATAQ